MSSARCASESGAVIGVRGPFGTRWGLDEAAGRDLVIVAGGVGLAPLRPVVAGALARRDRYGKVVLIASARSRKDFLYVDELAGGSATGQSRCTPPSTSRWRAGAARWAWSPGRCAGSR